MGMMREGFESLTTRGKTAIAIAFALALAWCITVCAIQDAGFREHQADMPADAGKVALTTTDGKTVFVDESDYDRARSEYAKAHGEDW